MKLDKIIGKVIALTKQVKPREPLNGSALMRQAFVGKSRRQYPLLGRMGLTWWITKVGLRICEDISEMAVAYDPRLQTADKEALCTKIESALVDNACDIKFFDMFVFITRAGSLFDARTQSNEYEFGRKLWNIIHKELQNIISDWLVLYPLSRINSPSFDLGYDGISLLSSKDEEIWKKLCTKYPDVSIWSPSTGRRKDDKDSGFMVGSATSWLACEIKGCETIARREAGFKMRMFLALLFSHLFPQHENLLDKSMGQTSSYSIQFPSEPSKVGYGQINAYIGTLLNPLIIDINIKLDILNSVLDWYCQLDSAPTDKRNRAIIGGHFTQYAICADDIDRFIHFFVALDALFGEQNRVEETIIKGIEKTFPSDKKWCKKAKYLYELRNSILHGGCSSIRNWKKLAAYRRWTNSDPVKDVGLVAMTALRMYFKLSRNSAL